MQNSTANYESSTTKQACRYSYSFQGDKQGYFQFINICLILVLKYVYKIFLVDSDIFLFSLVLQLLNF